MLFYVGYADLPTAGSAVEVIEAAEAVDRTVHIGPGTSSNVQVGFSEAEAEAYPGNFTLSADQDQFVLPAGTSLWASCPSPSAIIKFMVTQA